MSIIPLTDLDKLHIFDTIHDFWVERGINNEDTKQEKLRIYLVNFIKSFINLNSVKNVTDLNDILSYLTNTKIQSFHANNLSYERNIEKYYETVSSEFKPVLYVNTQESITYGEIIRFADDRTNPNSPWAKYKASYGIQNVLKIEVGDDQEYTSFGMVQKNNKEKVIADFILNYMFPEKMSNSNTFYLTSDANLKIMRKIFNDIKEVHSLITPANIADSANTKLQPFIQNRNDYIFPVKNNQNKQNVYNFDSNIYTKRSCNIDFTNNNFSNKNPYGFILNINNYTFRFSEKGQNGPSVNYLGDLITTDPGQKPKNQERSMLNINTLLSDTTLINSGILLDLKRTGDYEQVNSAITLSNDVKTPFVILTTVDILCSLYARIKQQNNIFHNGETMTLYRFTKGKVDENVLKLQRTKYRLIETVRNIIILQDLKNNRLFEDIEQSVVYWNRFFKDGLFKSNNLKQTVSEKIENIVTLIIQIRVSDILKKLNVLQAEIKKVKIPEEEETNLEYYIQKLNNIIQQIEVSKSKKNMNSINKQVNVLNIEEIIRKYENTRVNLLLNRTFELNSHTMKQINEGKNPLDLDYIVYENNTNRVVLFKHTGHCNILNFSNAIYNNIFNKLYNFNRIVSSSSSRNRDKKLYDRLSCDANDNYFTYIKDIYDTFFDKTLGEELYNILNPPKMDNKSMIEWYNNLGYRLKKCLDRNDPSIKYNLNYSGYFYQGGDSKRKIETPNNPSKRRQQILSIFQCQELSDVLRSIAGIAAAFIEGIITTEFNENVPSSLDTLIAYLQKEDIFGHVLEVMQEIEIVWVDGIMNIQRNINDTYEYVATEPEYLLLKMLSYYSNNNSNDLDDVYSNINNDFYSGFIYNHIPPPIPSYENIPSQQQPPLPSFMPPPPPTKRRGIGATTKVNDIGLLFLGQNNNYIPAEIINLLTLTLIDNTMQGDTKQQVETIKQGYFYNIINKKIPMNFFDNPNSWNDLPRYLYVYVSYIVKNNVSILDRFIEITYNGGNNKRKTNKRKPNKRNRKTLRIYR